MDNIKRMEKLEQMTKIVRVTVLRKVMDKIQGVSERV